MLQDKKSETDAEKQKVILTRLVKELSNSYPDLYYQSTTQIARLIRDLIDAGTALNGEERKVMERLGHRDIEVLLSLH